jgi:hypothetical protein
MDDVPRTGASFRKVILGKEAERFAVHLELFHVNLFQVELLFTILKELAHILTTPSSWIRRKPTWQPTFHLGLEGRWWRLGQERVGIAPQHIW